MQDGIKRMAEVVKDPQTLMFEMRKKRKDVIFWVAGIVLTLIVFLFISSKDYSFLIVLSSTVQMLSFVIILIKVYSYQNCSGLSLNTLISYLILLVARLSSTLFFNGYLPSDQAGDWFYQLTEIISLFCCCVLVYLMMYLFRDTANVYDDTIDFKYLVGPTFLLALLVHTSLNRNFITDCLWTFSMYLEAVAVYPQIYLFQKKGGQIESYTSHYVALQGLSRVFSLVFWYDTYPELNEINDFSFSLFHHYCGYFICLSQLIQLIIMIDYYYIYFKSIFKGEKMVISEI
jgi:ER lumen protein retaining receptor